MLILSKQLVLFIACLLLIAFSCYSLLFADDVMLKELGKSLLLISSICLHRLSSKPLPFKKAVMAKVRESSL